MAKPEPYSIAHEIDIRRVMVVDDVDETRELFVRILKSMDLDPRPQRSPIQALGHLKGTQLIICSWEMKDLSGAAFIQRVTKRTQKTVPFMIYSQVFSGPELALIRDAGIGNVLRLPKPEEEIKEIIEKIVEEESSVDPVKTSLVKARILIDDGKLNQAFELLKDNVSSTLHECRVKTMLAEVRMKKEQYAVADNLIKMALIADPNDTDAIRMQARIHCAKGELDKAGKILSRLYENSPLNMDNIIELSDTFAAQGDKKKALEVLGKGAEVDKGDKGLTLAKVSALAQGGDVNSAIAFLTQMGASEEYARELNVLAIGMSKSEEYDKAVQMYQIALSLLKDPTKCHKIMINIALIRSKQGQHIEAFELLAKIYCEKPSTEKAYALLSREYKVIKEKEITNQLRKSIVKAVKEVRAKHNGIKSPRKKKKTTVKRAKQPSR